MLDGAEQTASSDEIDVDSLMADIEAGKEIGGEAAPEAPAPAAPAPTAAEIQEMEITWNGKPVKAPIDRIKQWAGQGYDYAQKMQDFKAQQAAFEKAQKEFEPLKSRYAELDEYAKQNPQWLEHVNSAYLEAIGKAQAKGDTPEVVALKQELQALKEELIPFKNELTTERTQAKQKEEDEKLDSEIQSIREKYKDLDWATANSEGKTLETQVIEFAMQNGIKNFEHAFKLFNHDSLIALHASKAKEDTIKAKQAQTKAGLLGSTPAPTKQLERARSVKNKSYNDLTREALEELGLT